MPSVQKTAPASKAVPKKAQAVDKTASPAYDPNKPFQQIWKDNETSGDHKQIAISLEDAKRVLGHSYMSSKAEVTAITESFAEVPLTSFVIKASQQAYKHVTKEQGVSVKKVDDHENSATIANVQNFRVGQLTGSAAGNQSEV